MFDILKTLCELPGPVGREHAVHDFLLERWSPHAQSASITPVGNLVAHIGGDGPAFLIVGHGDEIGFTIKHISEDGYLFFNSGQRLGTDRPEMRGSYTIPTGQPALVVTRHGTVEGVFATLTGHILSQRQRETTQLEWNDMWVDICASSRDEVLAARDQGRRPHHLEPSNASSWQVYLRQSDGQPGRARGDGCAARTARPE